ncbi:MAG: cell division protein SepF [Acidobacteriaceae bacterium]
MRISDAGNVSEIAEHNRDQKGWELNLTALCGEDAARTVRFLTGAVMACGGYVLSRRFEANEAAAIEFEFVRALCVEMYSVLIASGLELTGQSHVIMAGLCQCTRETLEATAGDPVRVELTIRRAGALPRCAPGGSTAPPQAA